MQEAHIQGEFTSERSGQCVPESGLAVPSQWRMYEKQLTHLNGTFDTVSSLTSKKTLKKP